MIIAPSSLIMGYIVPWFQGPFGASLLSAADQAKLAAVDVTPGTSGFRLAPNATDLIPTDGLFSTIFVIPVRGNRIALYDGTSWVIRKAVTDLTYALAGRTPGLPFDVFAFWNGSDVALEIVNWTTPTPSNAQRQGEITKLDGTWVRVGDPTRRYLGSVRPRTATQYQVRRDARVGSNAGGIDYWNVDNIQTAVVSIRASNGSSWVYNSTTLRQANGDPTAQIETLAGIRRDAIALSLIVAATCTDPGAVRAAVSIGSDAITQDGTRSHPTINSAVGVRQLVAGLNDDVRLGVFSYKWLEAGTGAGTTTFQGQTDLDTHSGMTAIVPI